MPGMPVARMQEPIIWLYAEPGEKEKGLLIYRKEALKWKKTVRPECALCVERTAPYMIPERNGMAAYNDAEDVLRAGPNF